MATAASMIKERLQQLGAQQHMQQQRQAMGNVVPHWDLGLGPIHSHAWNKDRTKIAVALSGRPDVSILAKDGAGWRVEQVLLDHEMRVTGVDWAPETNRIATCSEDKSAHVYTYEDGQWKPNMVIIRSNRAATCIKWSPLENKLAVGTGAKLVSICSYDKENDWWICKQIKKPLHSTVLTVAWHPNNVLLATGSCDFSVRVFSTYIKELDDKPDPNPWGLKMPFGQVMAEYRTNGWVHALAFSPSGCRLCWASHDSTLGIVDRANRQDAPVVQYRSASLPDKSIVWINEHALVTAGFDCQPSLFTYAQGKTELKLVSRLDVPPGAEDARSGTGSGGEIGAAFQRFKNFSRNASSDPVEGVQLKTLHQNTITEVRLYAADANANNNNSTNNPTNTGGSVSKFTTSSLDGLIAVWDVQRRLAGITNGN